MVSMETQELQSIGSMVKNMPFFEVVSVDSVNCEAHGEFEQRTYGSGRVSKCPKCLDELDAKRKAEDEAERERTHQERIERFVTKLMGDSGLKPRFQNKMIRDYVAETEAQIEVVAQVKAYALEFNKGHSGRNMALIGNAGTGKTHLASAMVNHCIKNLHCPARFLSISKLNRVVRESKSFESDYTESQVIDALASCELLVIDEIGVQSGSDAESRALFDVFNARYEEMKPTVFISNLNLQGFAEAVGGRIMSRLREGGGEILSFDWEDYRK